MRAKDSETVYWFEVAALPRAEGGAHDRRLSHDNLRDNIMRMSDSGNQGIVIFFGERCLAFSDEVQSQRNHERRPLFVARCSCDRRGCG